MPLAAIESGKPSHRRPNLLYVFSDQHCGLSLGGASVTPMGMETKTDGKSAQKGEAAEVFYLPLEARL